MHIPKFHKRFLLLQIRLAEHWSEKGRERLELIALKKIEATIIFYQNRGLIETEEFAVIKDIINHLK